MAGRPHADGLPAGLAEIAEAIGRDAALDLALALGGQSVHIPRAGSLAPDHPLMRALGRHVAADLCERFQGSALYIPMARRALVRHLSARGLDVPETSRRLGITKSAVRRYRS